MRTIVYVDGFNLYYRLLKHRAHLKWVNPKLLAERCLDPQNLVTQVRYYTARVSGRTDPTSPARQQIYLDALATVPEISVHMGSFLSSTKYAGLVHPPQFKPATPLQMPLPWPDVVKVHKTEEKGSDVNLACHLLLDAFRGAFDVAAVLSNDSDLVEPIRIATKELRKIVGLLSPVPNPTSELQRFSSFVRRISAGDLAAAQFPNPILRADGSQLAKPFEWSQ